MLSSATLLFCLPGVLAFPSILKHQDQAHRRDTATPGCSVSDLCNAPVDVSDEEAGVGAFAGPNTAISTQRTNCGLLGSCTTFDQSAQYVSTTGDHAFEAPKPNEIRGPCPGLNAAANHGYLPRSGVLTQQDTINGLFAAYGMSLDLAEFLALYAIAFDGDVISMTWSIGGPQQSVNVAGLLGTPQGISYSHNKYEGDTSIGRCDAYTNGGNAHSLSTTRFGYAYASGMANDRYTLDDFAQEYAKNTIRSISTNDLYFAPLFSTTLVSPAAYNFVINFMSNHSAEEPAGYLDGAMFKQFFSIVGDYPDFTWIPGNESIPDNWYKRPSENQYSINSVFADLIPEFVAYPNTFRFGGNSNGKNTYTGIDINNMTGGVYNGANLFEGNNLQCFMYQNLQQATFDQLKGGANPVQAATNLISPKLTSAISDLGCPQANAYDDNTFAQYPGHSYSPAAPGEYDVC